MLTAQISAPQLGSVIDDIGTISKQVQPYLDVIKLVLADPALPTVVGQIRTISNLPSAPLGPTIPGQPVVKPPGIGLSAVVGPIDAFIWGEAASRRGVAYRSGRSRPTDRYGSGYRESLETLPSVEIIDAYICNPTPRAQAYAVASLGVSPSWVGVSASRDALLRRILHRQLRRGFHGCRELWER
jgi:hypothetical protein